jgi:thiamine phosphate phosphatase / amino-HMP aminohydrolase
MRLVFDFDGTITVRDTIGTLANAALRFQERRRDDIGDGGGGKDATELAASWKRVVSAYVEDCRRFTESYAEPEASRRSVAAEIRYLAALKTVEASSLARVEASGVFAGLDDASLFAMGQAAVRDGDVELRPGFGTLLERAQGRGWPVGVISVNWSRAFIEGALHPLRLPVYANDISPEGAIQGPPLLLGRRLTSSAGKLEVLREAFPDRSQGGSDRALYFGDSTTDLECLLQSAGVVIAASEDTALIETLRRIGIHVPHVSSPDAVSEPGEPANAVHWARDFGEILDSGILGKGDNV